MYSSGKFLIVNPLSEYLYCLNKDLPLLIFLFLLYLESIFIKLLIANLKFSVCLIKIAFLIHRPGTNFAMKPLKILVQISKSALLLIYSSVLPIILIMFNSILGNIYLYDITPS